MNLTTFPKINLLSYMSISLTETKNTIPWWITLYWFRKSSFSLLKFGLLYYINLPCCKRIKKHCWIVAHIIKPELRKIYQHTNFIRFFSQLHSTLTFHPERDHNKKMLQQLTKMSQFSMLYKCTWFKTLRCFNSDHNKYIEHIHVHCTPQGFTKFASYQDTAIYLHTLLWVNIARNFISSNYPYESPNY